MVGAAVSAAPSVLVPRVTRHLLSRILHLGRVRSTVQRVNVTGQVLLAAILTALLDGCATTSPPGPPTYLDTAESRAAYTCLLNETTWVNGNTYGPDGKLENKSANALRTLWQHPRAADAFASLVDSAEPAGRLYALCGLYYADRKRFDAEVPYLKFEKGKVKSIFDEKSASERVCDIVFCPYPETTMRLVSGCPPSCNPFLTHCRQHPRKKVWERTKRVVLAPGQTLAQWRKENSEGGFYLDIGGGGYPSLFKHGDIE